MGKEVVEDILPNFKINEEEIPVVRLKSIHFENFKVFENNTFDFILNGSPKMFSCFFGPNGCGKTTILDTIQILFSSFEGYDLERLKANLGKSVRHSRNSQTDKVVSLVENKPAEDFFMTYGSEVEAGKDFLITADIESSLGDYTVSLCQRGFIKDHPEEIKKYISRIYYSARFDQELHQFQLERSQWPVFKKLFEAVTGFTVEEDEGAFNLSEDPVQSEILGKYVLSFNVNKPDETISCKECSAGERKIIKTFSTLLNKEYCPQIILIDNVAMHVESGRHLELIRAIKEIFSSSQIFTTTHSHNISRNFGSRFELYDLRFLKIKGIMREEPWRIYVQDEIKNSILRLESLSYKNEDVTQSISTGYELLVRCEKEIEDINLTNDIVLFIQKVVGFSICDTVRYYKTLSLNN